MVKEYEYEGKMYPITDCWISILTNDDHSYEHKILGFFLGFILLNYLAVQFSKSFGHPLNIRPTIVGSTLHAFITGSASLIIVYLGPDYYYVWQQAIIPLTVGYFLADICVYCIPKLDWLITIHHITMIVCHFPVNDTRIVQLCTGGEKDFGIWLSMCGYTSEIVIPILSYRWWQTQCLSEHTTSFAVGGVFIILNFIARCLVMFYLSVKLYEQYDGFVKLDQLVGFSVAMLGHVTIFFMSVYWLYVILKNGLTNYLTFTKPTNKKSFGFGAAMGAEPAQNTEKTEKTKKTN
eukprot:c8755_g1_i1.p1 GENE.c8755_g1_i1~~c8755_g1_i1.p1  ORF type:complete len:292 (+),score=65.73 c8755_g1_i1:105-980(+)